MGYPRTIIITLLIISSSFSGCFSEENNSNQIPDDDYYPSLFERHNLEWNTSFTHSYLLNFGPNTPLEVEEIYINVETSGVWEGGPNSATVHLSYWLPSNTLEGEKVPVVSIISPYFSYGQPGSESTPTNIIGGGRGEFLYSNLISHGYAIAQVAVFATEESTGCFDYRGDGEGLGINTAIEWLGTQEWSNGNVAVYGKSYEGATAWEAAAQGNDHLKTIIPISGTTALHPLLYKNGSAEARSQVMHSNYGGSILDYDQDDVDNLCADVVEGFLAGPVTYVGGEMDPYMQNYYDERSHIDKALGVYNGSIYWVQGLQDWNVDPHQVFGGPSDINWYQEYIDNGYEVRGMVGQWGHNYPDQWTKHEVQDSGYGGEAIHNMTRWDWAQDLFEWLEYYLKDIGPKPDLHIQIQRNDGQWRVEETWPPQDQTQSQISLESCSNSGSWVGGVSVFGGGLQTITVECPALSEDTETHISGLVTLHLQVTATYDGGQIFVEMQDAETGLRLGHATMDIRYYAGGYSPQTVFPGQSLTMMMEFQGIDAILPAGHGIKLVMSESGEDYLAPACGILCPINVDADTSSILTIPHINRDGSTVFITPQQ